MTKTERLLKHLQSGKSITGRQALEKFNLYRLSSYIERFRKRGFKIFTIMIHPKKGSQYAKYIIL